jgi:photosystem II stability/assembly factor-like uncharacterized protein
LRFDALMTQITIRRIVRKWFDHAGGATWHAFTFDYSQAAPIAPEIVFGDPLVGYATVRGAIQRTVDGGAHWTQLKTPGT